MFERFTDRTRRVLVLSQEEARLLNHSFLGTEHLLLGLLAVGEGIAADALRQLDITLEAVRKKIEETIGSATGPPSGSPPFTPRAKKVLELSWLEARQQGHNYIGTEHLLLGLVREGEGVGAQVLVSLGVDLVRVRQQVIQLLAAYHGPEESPTMARPRWDVTLRASGPTFVSCSFCGRRPPESGQLVQGGRAFICEYCIREWAERLDTPTEPQGDPPTAKLYEPPNEPEEPTGEDD